MQASVRTIIQWHSLSVDDVRLYNTAFRHTQAERAGTWSKSGNELRNGFAASSDARGRAENADIDPVRAVRAALSECQAFATVR